MGLLRASISAVFILAATVGVALEAEGHLDDSERNGRVTARASEVSMDQAVKMAEQRFKARVVRADTQHQGVRTIYILKLLDESGRVWTVRVDATNGAIL
jgi:uncharacterized membrane protein YkoI